MNNKKIFTLKELEQNKFIEIGRGKVISRKDLQNHKGSFPVYSSSKINNGQFGTYGKFEFDEELITWSVDGGGKLFHRRKHKFSITNVAGFIRILRKDKIDCKYLFYCLANLHSKIKFDWVKKAHPSVLREVYNYIFLPSLKEQENIKTKINKSFELIDTAITNTIKKKENTKLLLDRIIFEKIKKIYSSSNIKRLQDVVEFKNGINYLKSSKNIPVKILGVKNFQSNIYIPSDSFETIFLDKELSKNYEIQEGDIFFVRSNGNKNLIGRSMLAKDVNYKATFSGFSIRARLQSKKILPEFLIFILRSNHIREQLIKGGSGTNISSLNQKTLSDVEVPLTSINEQHKFIKVYKEILKNENILKSILLNKIANLNTIKILILDKNVQSIAQ